MMISDTQEHGPVFVFTKETRKGIMWDVENAWKTVVAARAEGQTGRPSNRTKHRWAGDGLKMLKG